jgi:ubiquinone/menaquinone biosynthesis C-methylase UbiE
MTNNDGSAPKAQYQGFDTYTKQCHHSYVKENFKVLGDLLCQKMDSGELPKNAVILDVGCATGALIGYLSHRFPACTFEGLDISKELIEIARQKLPGIRFDVGGMESLPADRTKKFHVVLCIGVLGIFDEVEARDALHRLVSCVQPGGLVYVFSQFNEFDIDVKIWHRRVNPEIEWSGWATGWNIYSYYTITQWLADFVRSVRFIDFSMPYPLKPQENPVRTFTVEMADGSRKLTNGLKLLVELRFLEIVV